MLGPCDFAQRTNKKQIHELTTDSNMTSRQNNLWLQIENQLERINLQNPNKILFHFILLQHSFQKKSAHKNTDVTLIKGRFQMRKYPLCSLIILLMKKVPKNLGDPGIPTISCSIKNNYVRIALCDLS
jgi:hypothetical protein